MCSARRAVTLTELLVVIGVIVVLLGLLLPALGAVRSRGRMTAAASNMREVGITLATYASDFRDTVLPSQFNHVGDRYRGHARSACASARGGFGGRGTWADILWTRHEMGFFPEAIPACGHDYRFDSPDQMLYETIGVMANPLRSPQANMRDVSEGTGARPFGTGATERGWPGFFAANNFFNDDEASETYNADGPFSLGRIRVPERSVYLVDSFAGEVIEDDPEPFDNGPGAATLEVDFRYADACLMLMLDGHVEPQTPWADLDDLEHGRRVRIRNLTSRAGGGSHG